MEMTVDKEGEVEMVIDDEN
ncbi:uncharacterized protein G2W53_036336 [Senna tora]|uniref:Uncharacterized protein n=1 Tax=Senna tora TaxID=362788 RepID=A0A834SU75_9FABA|nr:uncharacterized protein G2W53_036336 [Senna tora]